MSSQPVRTNPQFSFTPKEQGVMEKLARIVTGVFGAWRNHVRARRCYRSKTSKDRLIEVMICLAEPMGGWHDQVSLDEPKELEDSQLDSRVQDGFRVIPM
jgi:hypothetical protein